MLLNNFDPAFDPIDTVVLGEGDWSLGACPSEKEIISRNLPFLSVRVPKKSIAVAPAYSIDGELWHSSFPKKDIIQAWISGDYDIIEGILRFKIQIKPDLNLKIREIGFLGNNILYAYRVIKEFVIGETLDKDFFVFNYNLKCDFVSSKNINFLL